MSLFQSLSNIKIKHNINKALKYLKSLKIKSKYITDIAFVKKIIANFQDYKSRINHDKNILKQLISFKENKKFAGWFSKLLSTVIKSYTKKVNLKYLRDKYHTKDKDTLANKIIYDYSYYTATMGLIAGGLGGSGGVFTIFLTDLPENALVTYYQVRMIYDLSVVYGKPIKIDDPEEVFPILLLAFEADINDMMQRSARFVIDKAGKLIIKAAGKRVFLKTIQRAIYKTLGIKVTQKAIRKTITKAVPIIGETTGGVGCCLINYYLTKRVADNVLFYYRTKSVLINYYNANDRISENTRRSRIWHWIFRKKETPEYISCSQVLAKACWIMVKCDGKTNQNKKYLVEYIFSTKPLEEKFINTVKTQGKIPVEELLDDFNEIQYRDKKKEIEIKKSIFYAMKLIAISDKKISGKEKNVLNNIAPYFDLDKKALIKELKDLKDDVFKI